MKNYAIITIMLAALGFAIFSNSAKASSKAVESPKKNNIPILQYSHESNILSIIAAIQRDSHDEDNINKIREKAYKLRQYLAWYYANFKLTQHQDKYLESEVAYQGIKVLEIKYGGLLYSGLVTLPLSGSANPLNIDLLAINPFLSSFKDGEISSVKVAYITYDFSNQDAVNDFNNLFLAIQKSDFEQIKKNIANIYGNILVYHSSKVSFVSKIRDNLAVARYLFGDKQDDAAEDSVESAISMMSQLIDLNSRLLTKQEEIKKLRAELEEDNLKALDPLYLLRWEKIPLEMDEAWRNN
jgi:hypothetical protein